MSKQWIERYPFEQMQIEEEREAKMLDVLTSKGIEMQEHEQRAVELWHQQYPLMRFHHTPKAEPAVVDGVITNNGIIRGVVEVKCREMTEKQFDYTYKSEWLVTLKKIQECAQAAGLFRVPFIGFLYLIQSDTLLWDQIADKEGNLTIKNSHRDTITKATCNGGMAERTNIFLDMSNCKRIFPAK